MRVPGSNPGGTIFAYYFYAYCLLSFFILYPQIYAYIPLSYLPFPYETLKKQRREVSINRPASYEPAALPLRHPAYLPFFIHPLLFLVRSSFIPYFLFPKKVPLPGIEPGAQT